MDDFQAVLFTNHPKIVARPQGKRKRSTKETEFVASEIPDVREHLGQAGGGHAEPPRWTRIDPPPSLGSGHPGYWRRWRRPPPVAGSSRRIARPSHPRRSRSDDFPRRVWRPALVDRYDEFYPGVLGRIEFTECLSPRAVVPVLGSQGVVDIVVQPVEMIASVYPRDVGHDRQVVQVL
jgi:hypothetical protein